MSKLNKKNLPTRGDRNIEWIEKFCRIPEGKYVGQPVKLAPFQKELIKGIYDTPTRRAIVSYGRKNAKTTTSAFLLLLHLCGTEAKPNSQLYSAAQSREQASILFNLAAKIVRLSPELSQYVGIRDTAKQLYCSDLGTLYRALSAEASTAYGLSNAFTVHDELGQVRGPRSELYEALETASAAQENPLSIIISTQAAKPDDLLSLLIDDAKQAHDPMQKVWLYTADPDIDPFSEEAIRQANPAFDFFMNKQEVFAQAEDARRMPSRESGFRNLILNQRVETNNPFISKGVWILNSHDVDDSVFYDEPVYVGLDLSAKNDLTAMVMVAFREKWHVKAYFWTPSKGLHDRAKRDRQPYDVWVKQGYIRSIDGSSLDYEVLAREISEILSECNVQQIAFDRWRIDLLKKEFEELGIDLPLVEFGQGFKDMSPALESLETLLLNEKMAHGNNPVLTMCVANTKVSTDPAGNRKLDKQKATGRIDGAVALAMAIGVTNGAVINEKSFWESA